jgi:predicted metal-dependent enzyme (double-stranded beta helix superfamily)
MCELINSIQSTLQSGPVTKDSLEIILQATKEFIPQLQDELCCQDWKAGRYMLYKDPKYGFVIMMLVWGMGDATPIHAHGTWGVEAVIKSSVRVTSYTACQVNPCVREVVDLKAGDVAYVLPPDEDVHVVAQLGGLPAITVHIYGKELVENIVFSPGSGYRALPVSCSKVKTNLFDFSTWQSAEVHTCRETSFI